MHRHILSIAIIALVTVPAAAGDWPAWRGPDGNGVSTETGLAVRWSETDGLAWKTKLPEWGTSTPIVWGESIFLTAHTADGKLLVLKLDKSTGRIAWTRQLGRGKPVRGSVRRGIQVFHRWHNMASSSAVTDGRRVVVQFGTGDLAALDFDGKVLWKRNLQKDHGDFTIWWGYANSPVLVGDRVISVAMQDSLADRQKTPVGSYLVAHEIGTGRPAWKTPRKTAATAEQCDAYTTPLLLSIDGRRQLVVMGANQLDGYDPVNGRQLWFLPGLGGGRTVPTPTAGDGLIYVVRGLRGPIVAVRPGGSGKLPDARIAWDHRQNTPDTCCPVLYRGLLFTVADDGVAQCLDAKTGKLQWRSRLAGQFKASPLAADGRIYFPGTNGTCSVFAAERTEKKLAENRLDDQLIASPAVSEGMILLRGHRSLYAIAKPR